LIHFYKRTMSFFNFGPSPTKSSGHGQQSSSSDFNMFGAGSPDPLFGGQEGTTGGSFFGGPGESGGSIFGSAGLATPMKQEQGSGQGNDITPPLKKQRPESSQLRTKQTSSVQMPGNPKTAAYPTKQHLAQEKLTKNMPVDNDVHEAPSSSEPSKTPGLPQYLRENPDQTKASAVYQDPSTASFKVQDQPTSAQSSILKNAEKPKLLVPSVEILTPTEKDGGHMPADQIFRDLLDMQRQHLSELLPELKASDEKSGQVLDSAMLVLKEVDNYSEKLAGIKQQYISRLSQVSSFLKMIPKHEK